MFSVWCENRRARPIFMCSLIKLLLAVEVGITRLDVVEAVTRLHDVESTIDEPSQPESMDSNESIRQSDWTSLYIAFGLCSLLAFGCYRRGAT